jgi:hypothetical protein
MGKRCSSTKAAAADQHHGAGGRIERSAEGNRRLKQYTNRHQKLSPDGKSSRTRQRDRTHRGLRAPFPGRRRDGVSVDGGDQPIWSRDGRELFYRDGAKWSPLV